MRNYKIYIKKEDKYETLKRSEIEKIYKMVSCYYEKFLKKHGVKLPALRDRKGNYTKDALVLVYLANDHPNTMKLSKAELTQIIRQYYPEVADVQQARHLAAQKGWFIISGTRGNSQAKAEGLGSGEYRLLSLKEPYPGFIQSRSKREEEISEKVWEGGKEKV